MISAIGFDRELTFDQVKKSLLELFPDWVIFADDPETGYPREMNWNRLDHAWVQVDFHEDHKDFPHYICIQSGAKEYDQRQSLHIARKLSEDYNVRTITEYNDPEREDNYGICILFDRGKNYLADDYADSPMIDKDEARGVIIIKEMEIPHYHFDSTGDYLGIVTKEES